MFELDGLQISLQEIQDYADQNNLDFDQYMQSLRDAGLKDIDNDFDDEDMGIFTQLSNVVSNFVGPNVKSRLIEGFYLPAAQLLETVYGGDGLFGSGILDNATNFYDKNGNFRETGLLDPRTNEIVTFDKKAYERDGIDAVENQKYYNLLTYQKLENSIQNRLLGREPKVKRVFLDDKTLTTNAFDKSVADIIKKNIEIGKSRKKILDPGVTGFVDAVKKGELDDVFVQGVDFLLNTTTDVALAYATASISMASQMYGNSYITYNSEKANQLYGNDPDAIEKLLKNNEDEFVVPTALAGVGYLMERAGYKGIMKELAKSSFKGKKALSLFLTGNKEGLTEYGQGLTERLNANLGKQMDFADSMADVARYMGTEEAWDNYFAGLVGGTGIAGGGRLVQGALRSDQASSVFVSKKIDNISSLLERKTKTLNKKELKEIDDLIQIQYTELKEYLENNKKISEYLKGDEKTTLMSLVNSRRDNAKKISDLKKSFRKGLISSRQYAEQVNPLIQSIQLTDANIKTIKLDANMRLLKEDLASGDIFVGDVKGLEQKVFDTQEDFYKALEKEYKRLGKKMPNYREQGALINGIKLGNTIFINAQVAAETNAVTTGTHEILHGILKSTIQENDGTGNLSAKGQKIVKSFINTLSSKQLSLIEKFLEKGNYKLNKDGTQKEFKEYGEEYLTIYAHLSKEGQFGLNALQKIGKWFSSQFNDGEFKNIGFEDGSSVKNFLDAYVEDAKQKNFRQLFKDLAKEGLKMDATVEYFTDNTNAVKDLAKMGWTNDSWKEQGHKFAIDEIIRNGYLDRLIASKLKVPRSYEETKNFIKKVMTDLLPDIRGFKPEDNDNFFAYLQPRINFRAGDVYKRESTPEQLKKAKNIDERTKEGTPVIQIAEEQTDTETKQEFVPKSQRERKLKPISNVNIENKDVISAETKNKINKLIEENSSDLETKLNNLIKKDILKSVKQQMGDVSSRGGNVVISEEYKAFLALNYDAIIQGLDVTTIKKNYNKLFKIEKIGFEDKKTRKADKPSLKKDSNYRKGVFKIKIPSKAEFTKYFIEGGYTTLKERQKKLANIISESFVQDSINETIIEQSSNIDAVLEAKLRNYAVKLNRQKKEIQGNYADQVKMSAQFIEDARKLKADVEAGLNVFNEEGDLQPGYSKYDKLVGDFVYLEIIKDGLYNNKEEVDFLGKAFAKLINSGERGVAYESYLIDAAIKIESTINDPKIFQVIQRQPDESDNKPDLIIRINGVDVNIEAKMLTSTSGAQYGSITVSQDGDNFFIKKDYTFKNELENLIKKANKGRKAAKKFLKDTFNYDWQNFRVLPLIYHKALIANSIEIDGKVASYFNHLGSTIKIPLSYISEIYNKKDKYPVNYIQLLNAGLFHMGEDVNNFGTVAFEGEGSGTLRVGKNTKYKRVNGKKVVDVDSEGRSLVTYTYRFIPNEISKKTILDLKNKNIDGINLNTSKGLEKLIKKDFTKIKSKTKEIQTYNKAVSLGQMSVSYHNNKRGMSTFDFDETLIDKGQNFITATLGDETIKISSAEWPTRGTILQEKGYDFDFSDFVNVRGGVDGPLLQKMRNQIKKFGPDNVFVLTARPPESATAIHEWLKTKNINIPLENITGLGNSTGEAKALWMLEKFGQGYNDMYFVDDALQNVKAVKNVLEQLDVKSNVQQVRAKFSVQFMDKSFNDILQDVSGIDSSKRYSQAKARKRGEGKGRFRFFVPPSHEDFVGLLYNFIGKGEAGNRHRDFFEKALIKPLNRAYKELNSAKQAIANDYKYLIRSLPNIRTMLTMKTPDDDYYYSDAVRVYLWDKAGFNIPGMSQADIKNLSNLVKSNKELKEFADKIGLISRQENGYVEPGEHWQTGDIRTDLADATGRVGRKQFFGEFQENADIIFSKDNLNKIEAIYGINVREAIEDMLTRIKTGTNRTVGKNKIVNRFLDYINGSIGATMFFNARSAVLQTISTVNFINFGDNNIFKAAKAFANQPQFWSDFVTLFNSDMLKQRRAGVAFDINANELASSVAKSKNPARAAIAYLLQIGFLPTQIADSFAISLGGASMYRNRVNTYLKQNMSQKDAETKAFNDFQEIAETTQQSARPDKISQQQASVLGRMILAFQNTPSQYVRLMKKAGSDLINRRKTPPYNNQVNSDMSNISKIIYYGAIQNFIFYSLQSAMFAMFFEDEEKDEEFFNKKRDRVINGSLDTVLRGMGVGGAVISTIKNTAIKYAENQKKDWGKEDNVVMMEMLQLSPPIGIKARKLSSAQKTMDFNEKVIDEMQTFDIDNPIWSAISNATEATTNVPLNRLHRKTMNLREAANAENEWWQRLAMALGWSRWDVGVENKEVEAVKKEIKQRNKRKTKRKGIREGSIKSS